MAGERYQTLLGATGTGKTATMAWIIEKIGRPALVIAHNKTLAAQLCNEFREFFPTNAVEYFVSYYDYYQPEAYVPQADLYIEKDSSRNDDIDRLRHAATSSLLSRRDTIIVASVSCIYGLGSPEEYEQRVVLLTVGEETDRDLMLRKLIDIQYARNDTALGARPVPRQGRRDRGAAGVHGVGVPDLAVRRRGRDDHALRPADGRGLRAARPPGGLPGDAVRDLEADDRARRGRDPRTSSRSGSRSCDAEGKQLEAHRLRQRTEYDMEMMVELGFCSGIENYSRILDGRPRGLAPVHADRLLPVGLRRASSTSRTRRSPSSAACTRATARASRRWSTSGSGCRPRSTTGRCASTSSSSKVPQLVFVSATPGPFELRNSKVVAEQLIRPTFIVDPEVELRATKNQIDDLLNEVRRREEAGERVLVTTLTKKMAEDLTDYLLEAGVKARYLHSEIDTLERIQIIRELRLGEYDVLVGVNLLREGLDLPGGLAGRDPRRRQGGLPARQDRADPDDRPRRAQHQREGAALRRQDDRGDPGRARGDEPAPREAARVQRGARDHAGVGVKGVSDIAEFLMLDSPTVPARRRRGKAEVEGMDRRRSSA